MFKGLKKIMFAVLGIYLVLTALHFWLNIGFDKLGLARAETHADNLKFRVGFLPVT